MQFVLGNRHLLLPGGTEVHLVTIGEHLRRFGHEVVLYAPQLGPFAEHARGRGLEVTDALDELPEACDVVFAQDSIVAYELADRYPRPLHVFRVCGDVFDFQLPPQAGGVVDVVVAASDRYARIARAAVPDVPMLRLRVPIDIDVLVPPGPLAARPRRAIVFGNYDDRHEAIATAWGERGVEVLRVGGAEPVYDLPQAFAGADVVVAKGRAALDAMACGRAVYVFDVFGGDGWVTPELHPALEADNFAGQATDRVIDTAALAADLDGYRQEMGVSNRDLILQHHSARDHVVELLASLDGRVPATRPPAPVRELARLVALQWSWERTAREYQSRYWAAREHAEQAARLSAEAAESAEVAERERRRAHVESERAVAAASEAIRDATIARDDALRRLAELEAQVDPAAPEPT